MKRALKMFVATLLIVGFNAASFAQESGNSIASFSKRCDAAGGKVKAGLSQGARVLKCLVCHAEALGEVCQVVETTGL